MSFPPSGLRQPYFPRDVQEYGLIIQNYSHSITIFHRYIAYQRIKYQAETRGNHLRSIAISLLPPFHPHMPIGIPQQQLPPTEKRANYRFDAGIVLIGICYLCSGCCISRLFPRPTLVCCLSQSAPIPHSSFVVRRGSADGQPAVEIYSDRT